MRHLLLPVVCFCCIVPSLPATPPAATNAGPRLRVMTWNIWHGGREDGDEIGPQRVLKVIRQSRADLVAMQETYGSGERIAKELGFHFLPRGTNVSIHSRYPIREDISVFEPFKCVGGLIELPAAQPLAFYSIWLPYGEDIWRPGVRAKSTVERLQRACQVSADDLKKIVAAIEKRLEAPRYEGIDIVIAGDFNSMSHLDYIPAARKQYGRVIDWRTSRMMTEAGFQDSYRQLNPTVDRRRDATWSPRFPDQQQDRIDFIYDRCQAWRAIDSRVVREHADRFPSDHAAVITTFAPVASTRPPSHPLPSRPGPHSRPGPQ